MKKLRIAILVLGAAWPVLAQKTAKDVKVVNTPNVTVANTPGVIVANTPSVTVANNPTVIVANTPTVTVANSPAVTVASNPFVVTSPVNSATPFNVTLPSTTSDGRPIKTVVIEFVTADCDAGPGTTLIGAAKLRVLYAGNFAFYTLPFDPPMSFSNGSEFASAPKTLIFADPGAQLNYGLSAAQPTCTVVFSGHLE
jgi:hypothetical protein